MSTRVNKHNNYKERTITCKKCGSVVTKRMPKGRQYCSVKCSRKDGSKRKTGKVVNCENCGMDIYKSKSNLDRAKNNFCSKECANEYQGRNKVKFICKTCLEEFRRSKSRVIYDNTTYCSMLCRNADKERMLENSIKGNLANLKKNGLNSLEKKGSLILNELGVIHETQVLMFNKFTVDVLIEELKLVIQWDGEYWHSKPKRIALDKSQDAYMEKCGYIVLRITDEQIKNDLNGVYDLIKKITQLDKIIF